MPPGNPQPQTSHGATVSFSGSEAQVVTSLRYSRSRGRLDVTGLSTPAYMKKVIPGDIEPATIVVGVLASQPYAFGGTGSLTVSFGGASFSFSNAFLESVDIGAEVGEFIKATYTFVASD